MSRVWLDMPEPLPGTDWCQACAMLLKQAILEEYEGRLKARLEDGKDGDHTLTPHLPWQPRAAVVAGICAEMQQFGPMRLCWTHLAGVKITPVSPLAQGLPGPGQLPPGLLRGRG